MLTPAQTSNPTLVVLESRLSLLRRSAQRALTVGRVDAAIKWRDDAHKVEREIAAMCGWKAGVQ